MLLFWHPVILIFCYPGILYPLFPTFSNPDILLSWHTSSRYPDILINWYRYSGITYPVILTFCYPDISLSCFSGIFYRDILLSWYPQYLILRAYFLVSILSNSLLYFAYCLTIQDGINVLSRNVGNQLSIYATYNRKRAKILLLIVFEGFGRDSPLIV
jgi:hypothetical protein